MEAARHVLEHGSATSFAMEDVARAAGIARQTVYKYVATRDDLIIAIFIEEMRTSHFPRITEAAREREPSVDALTELVMIEWRTSREFSLYSEVLDPSVAPRMAEMVFGSDEFLQARLETWTPILERYEQAGVLRPGLDHRDVLRWITYQEFWFVTQPDTLCADERIPSFVRGMIVPALLTSDQFAETVDPRTAP